MEVDNSKLHILFLPYLSPSHMIPLVDAARCFASRGIKATIVTTPFNAILFKSSVDHDIASGHPIFVHVLEFPEVGLPEGVENFSAVTSLEMAFKVNMANSLLREPVEQLIRDLNPNCIFSDMFYPWTVDVAKDLKIPRLSFYPTNFFYHCVFHNLKLYTPYETVQSDSETFFVPDLPDGIEMTWSQLEDYATEKTQMGEFLELIRCSDSGSFGLVHNSFYELEPAYADYYRKIKGQNVWEIGPLFHFSNANTTSEPHDCLDWLDTQRPNSVLYVCFGSLVIFSDSQLTEIARALESSKIPFIWVVKMRGNEKETWLPEGFEERMTKDNKALLIRDWAPQLNILNHQSIGGFMTHCGWNSSLEAVTAGVPLILWPLFAEQFYNQKFMEILGTGIGVGSYVWNATFEISGPIMKKDKIEYAVKRLMGDSEEGRQMRERAKRIAKIAKEAVKDGGSSYTNITTIIEEIKSFSFEKQGE